MIAHRRQVVLSTELSRHKADVDSMAKTLDFVHPVRALSFRDRTAPKKPQPRGAKMS